jgi:hypothetical protein
MFRRRWQLPDNRANQRRSDSARFDDAMSKLLSVPKTEIDKRLAEEKKAKEAKRRKAG